jgi:hypothetical protein
MAIAVILIQFHIIIMAGMAVITTGTHIFIRRFTTTRLKNTPKDLLTGVLLLDPVLLPAAGEDQARLMEQPHPALLVSGEPAETLHPVLAPGLHLTAEAELSAQTWTENVRLFAPARMLMSEE